MADWKEIKNFGSDRFYNLSFLVLEQFLYKNPLWKTFLCRKTGFSTMQTYKVFTTLEKFGLIQSRAGRNKRKKMFYLTRKGKKVAKCFVSLKHALKDVIDDEKRKADN